MLLILGTVLLAVALLFAIDTLFQPAAERRASLERVVSYATAQQPSRAPTEKRPGFVETVVPAMSRIALRLTPKAQSDQLESRLAAAGVKRFNVQQFLALKTGIAALGIVLGFLLGGGITLTGLFFAVLFAAGALLLPDMLLVRKVRRRAERLSDHLPQAIDQIAISLEAGLSFDAAVSYLVRRSNSPLADELRTMLTQIRMGESRSKALKNLSD